MIGEALRLVTPLQAAVVVVALLAFYTLTSRMNETRKIKRLGFRAPTRPSRLPFGLDIAYEGTMMQLKNKSLEFFEAGN
jgi:hypothetical protein